MENYKDYLPELKSTTLFQGIEDDALLELLSEMQPRIVHVEADGALPIQPPLFPEFAMFLRGYPQKEIAERRFIYDMPKFGEPGMLMGEIPSLSRMNETDRPMRRLPMPHKSGRRDPMDVMLFSGEMVTRFYSEKVSAAQSAMLRNFLGILAQKVTDIRHELFIARDNFDIYGEE